MCRNVSECAEQPLRRCWCRLDERGSGESFGTTPAAGQKADRLAALC